MREGGQKEQISLTNKSWGCTVWHGDNSQQYYIVHLKFARRVDLRSSHSEKKFIAFAVMDVNL